MKTLLQKAKLGDIRCQVALALCFEAGIETEVNLEKALYWWKVAEQHGDLQATSKIKQLQDKLRRKVSSTKSKILLVGTHSDEVVQLRNTLEKEQYKVHNAANLTDAMKCIFQNPDINTVIIDADLPNESGFNLLKKMKTLEVLQKAEIILLLSNSQVKVVETAIKLKPDRLVIKPVNTAQLVDSIKAAHSKIAA